MWSPAIASLRKRLARTTELAGEKRRARLESIREDAGRYRNNPHIDDAELDAIESEVGRRLAEGGEASD
jgi:hypothetical protein